MQLGRHYRYERYERLMFEPAARAALFTFVSGRPLTGAGSSVQQQRLHAFKCSQRVANYGQLRASLVLIEQDQPSCNETVAACDYLEQQHEDDA